MTPIAHPYLHAIFCEDVRQEITGKMLHIGVYSAELITPSYPLLLPKLAVVAYFGHPLEDKSSGKSWKPLSLSLVLDEEVLLELEHLNSEETPEPLEGSRGHLMTLMMAMAPFQLARPGRLRVKIRCDNGAEVLSNALVCRVPLPSETEQSEPQQG